MSLWTRARSIEFTQLASSLHVPLLVGLAAACTATAIALVRSQLHKRRCSQRRLRVVITGASKGLGFALACAHVKAGDSVVICGRDESAVHDAVSRLNILAPGRAFGTRCDVTRADDVAALFEFAREHMSGVDMLINNAGVSFTEYKPLADIPVADVASIVATNLTGTLLCAREAVRTMSSQLGGGHIFNMDGAGSRGNATPRYAVYGATKAALPQLMASLVCETRDLGIGVHTLSPGMVITDLLMGRKRHDKGTLRIFNILAEKPETTAAWLVPRARAIACVGITDTEAARREQQLQLQRQPVVHAAGPRQGPGQDAPAAADSSPLPVVRAISGTYLCYLTPMSALRRFLTRGLTRRAKNRLVDESTGEVL